MEEEFEVDEIQDRRTKNGKYEYGQVMINLLRLLVSLSLLHSIKWSHFLANLNCLSPCLVVHEIEKPAMAKWNSGLVNLLEQAERGNMGVVNPRCEWLTQEKRRERRQGMVNPSDDAGFFCATACHEICACWIDCRKRQEWQSELSLVRLCEGCVYPQRIDSMIEMEMGMQRVSVVAELP